MGRPKKIKPEEVVKPLENAIIIEHLPEIIAIVIAETEEKKRNPSVVLEGETGLNFIAGEPHVVIGNKYVPHAEAMIILQERKVVREWLKLQNLKKGLVE